MARNRSSKTHRSNEPRPLRAPLPRVAEVLAEAAVWGWLLLVWWYHDSLAKDAFRLPKHVLSEAAVAVSLTFLAWKLWSLPRLEPAKLWRLAALRAILPFVVAASLGFFTSSHPAHVRSAFLSLLVGAAALVGWSVGFSLPSLRRLNAGTLVPAVALAAFGILQFHDLYRPFDFAGELERQRLGVTSFAGSAGDLAVFLVLPCLIAQVHLWRSRGSRRWLWALALAVCLYALAVTQTLSALAAFGLGSSLLWLLLLPWRRTLPLAAAALVLAGVLVAAVGPLRERVVQKGKQLASGDVNALLTGRLDGWRAASWMFRQEPLFGVGHGAFRAEFADAKLALMAEGVPFYRSQVQVMFANAHNELLEVAADLGLAGALALGWGLWVLFGTLRRRARGPDTALAWAGVAALAVLALAQFPFRLALTGYQAVLFLALVFAEGETPS